MTWCIISNQYNEKRINYQHIKYSKNVMEILQKFLILFVSDPEVLLLNFGY